MENSPKFVDRMRDISSWPEGDSRSLSTRAKKKYNKCKSAIEDYFTSNATIAEITQRTHISEEYLLQLVEKCLMQAEDGDLWGFRALIPGVDVKDYAAHPAPKEETLRPITAGEDQQNLDHATQGADATSLSSTKEVEPASSAGEAEIEDKDYDTAQRLAIKSSLQSTESTVSDADVPETPLAAATEDPDAEFDAPTVKLEPLAAQAEAEAPIELDEPTATLEPLTAPEAEAEAPIELDEPTVTLEPLAVDEEVTSLEPEQDSNIEEAALPELEQSPAGEKEETREAERVANVEAAALAAPAAPVAPAIDQAADVVKPEVEKVEEPEHLDGSENDEHVTVPADAQEALAEVERILVEEKEENSRAISLFNGAAAEKTLPLSPGSAPLIPFMPSVHLSRGDLHGKRAALQRRLVRKRWIRDEHGHTKKQRLLRIVSLTILAAVLLFVIVPVSAGFAAYGAYNNINGIARDGVNHLLKVKSLLPISKSDPTAALNVKNLEQAQVEFKAAQGDFDQLQQLVDRADVQAAITQFAPQYSNKLGMAQRLVQVALDVSHMGNELTGVALIGANIIHGSPLSSGSTKPVISTADIAAIDGSMVHALYYINDIQQQMSQVSIKDIPISDSQKKQLASVMALLPQAHDTIVQAQGMIGVIAWLLGVGQQRRFLVQTMDSAELRPGGGFTGQYGILQIQDGRMSPFTLTDVTLIDYAENGTAIGRTAPPGYSWMNFGNWGVRDSNLSGDFPTTARMTMQLYQDEGGGPVDGDIAFTPKLIGHILDVIGPIKVPGYNETITSQNLEERLHYYQQDFSAIAREKQISGNYTHAGRKAFTSTLGKMLLDRVRHASVKQITNIVKGAIKDIQSRDLEIYFTNPTAETWLVDHGYSGSIDTFAKQDGFMVVQANISISKASQYVHTTEQDAVTLDAQGGATHNLTITLDYQQKGPVYGFDTYADYIRVYAPRNAQLTGGDGFDTGRPLCKPTPPKPGAKGTPAPTSCAQYNTSFPSSARYCPSGNYSLGLRGGLNTPWVIDSLGAPTALTSDLPGRAMWGGLTETPKNCISYISLSWYVPQAVQKVHGQPSYTVLVQKQSGYSPTIELSIDASAIKGLKSFNFKGDIIADKAFTLAAPPPKKK